MSPGGDLRDLFFAGAAICMGAAVPKERPGVYKDFEQSSEQPVELESNKTNSNNRLLKRFTRGVRNLFLVKKDANDIAAHQQALGRSAQAAADDRPNAYLEMHARIKRHAEYEDIINSSAPYGFFSGRPVIGECTKIHGGIYVGAVAHEAIVVDKKYAYLELVGSELMLRINLKREVPDVTITENELVTMVIALVRDTLTYDSIAVESLLCLLGIGADDKVALDLFIKEKVGVARHHILLSGYLLEFLKDNGLVKGSVSLELDREENEKLTYTCTDGKLIIFEPGKIAREVNPKTA